jgi:hypothetical protein
MARLISRYDVPSAARVSRILVSGAAARGYLTPIDSRPTRLDKRNRHYVTPILARFW